MVTQIDMDLEECSCNSNGLVGWCIYVRHINIIITIYTVNYSYYIL